MDPRRDPYEFAVGSNTLAEMLKVYDNAVDAMKREEKDLEHQLAENAEWQVEYSTNENFSREDSDRLVVIAEELHEKLEEKKKERLSITAKMEVQINELIAQQELDIEKTVQLEALNARENTNRDIMKYKLELSKRDADVVKEAEEKALNNPLDEAARNALNDAKKQLEERKKDVEHLKEKIDLDRKAYAQKFIVTAGAKALFKFADLNQLLDAMKNGQGPSTLKIVEIDENVKEVKDSENMEIDDENKVEKAKEDGEEEEEAKEQDDSADGAK